MWSLDTSLGFKMVRTARSLKRALDTRLAAHELTASQYIVLARLWVEDGISLTELGERLSLDNPTLTGVVDRMERDGLLERKRNDGDRRVIKVYLTPKGHSLHEKIGSLAEQTDNDAWKDFTPAQRQELMRALDIIWERFNG